MMFTAHACRQIWDQHDHNNNNSWLFICSYCISLFIFLHMNNHTASELCRLNSSANTRNKMYTDEKIQHHTYLNGRKEMLLERFTCRNTYDISSQNFFFSYSFRSFARLFVLNECFMLLSIGQSVKVKYMSNETNVNVITNRKIQKKFQHPI